MMIIMHCMKYNNVDIFTLLFTYIGRLRTFQLSSVVFILGVVIVCSATEFYTLIFGRLFVGLGVGLGLAVSFCLIMLINFVSKYKTDIIHSFFFN